MLKNKSGITLITLVFIIIIIIILTSIFVATSLRALNEARNSEIQSEKHALEGASQNRYVSYIKNDKSTNVELIGASPSSRWNSVTECIEEVLQYVDLSDLPELDQKRKKDKISSDIAAHYDEYIKIITVSDAKRLGVDHFLEDSIYVLDYYTSTAYGPIK